MPSPMHFALSGIFAATEFWTTIFGAIVGGFIALAAQVYAVRVQRKQRDEDRKQLQTTLAHVIDRKNEFHSK